METSGDCWWFEALIIVAKDSHTLVRAVHRNVDGGERLGYVTTSIPFDTLKHRTTLGYARTTLHNIELRLIAYLQKNVRNYVIAKQCTLKKRGRFWNAQKERYKGKKKKYKTTKYHKTNQLRYGNSPYYDSTAVRYGNVLLTATVLAAFSIGRSYLFVGLERAL